VTRRAYRLDRATQGAVDFDAALGAQSEVLRIHPQVAKKRRPVRLLSSTDESPTTGGEQRETSLEADCQKDG
jgi:hypothetical protein